MRIFVLLLLFNLLVTFQLFAQYSVDNLPSPKVHGQEFYVSNPDGILDNYNVNTLNKISFEIDSISGAEYAVVIVNDYVGDSDFEFALALFNKWGIGKKGADNGLLLFVSKERREYRFISGYGMERIFPDAYLKRVGEKYLVPNFRNLDYDEGVLEASNFIAQVLKSPDSIKELEALMPEATPFWSFKNPFLMNTLLVLGGIFLLYLYVHLVSSSLLKGTKTKPRLFVPIFWGLGCMGMLMFFTIFIFAFVFHNVEEVYQIKNLPYFALVLGLIILSMKIFDGRTKIIQGFKDEENIQKALKKFVGFLFIPMLLTPLAWMDLSRALNRIRQNQGRFVPPDNNPDWIRINRDRKNSSASDYLNQGQVKEEKLRSLRYEIWENSKTKKVKLVPWEVNKDFETCPKCGFYTFELNRERTLVKATYSSKGEGEKYDGCRNCSYEISKGTFIIAKKVRSSSSGSSSSGGGSSGGGGSSSGGGSFGGGSSGGGGAGGRW